MRKLTEDISLIQYYPDFYNAIKSAINTALVSTTNIDFTGDIEEESEALQLITNLESEFYKTFKHTFVSSCRSLAKKINPNLSNFAISLTLKPRGRFVASLNAILISDKVMQEISLQARNGITDVYNTSEYFDSADEFFGEVLRNKGKILQGLDGIINRLSKTCIHELTHSMQYESDPRPNTLGYTSKLNDPKKHKGGESEFHQVLKTSEPGESRYDTLYFSSPQEIEAWAHNASIDIILKNKVNNIRELKYLLSTNKQELVRRLTNLLDVNEIQSAAEKFLKKITPLNKLEQRKSKEVFRRYLKLIYTKLSNYSEHLLETLRSGK